jgi:hypothetical protein
LDFSSLSIENLDHLTMSKLVFDDNDISTVLKGHLFIEKILETLISKHLPNPNSFFYKPRTFALKIDLAKAMGLLDEEHESALKALNKIRNNYVHIDNYQLKKEDLNNLKFDWEEIQNKAFSVALTKGIGEAAKITLLFLCWKAIHLLSTPET